MRPFAVIAAVVVMTTSAAPAATTDAGVAGSARVGVYLLQGEGLRLVQRQAAQRTVTSAVTALLQGPTTVEAKADVRTQVPKGTRLRRASVAGGTATIDLSRPYVEGTDQASFSWVVGLVVF